MKFKEGLVKLRVMLPPIWPVKVRRVKMEDWGDCSFVKHSKQGPHFIIRISNELSDSAQFMVLLHEWAHALSWGSDTHHIRNHGPEWGISMSRVWQTLLED
jgi:hypothetical protein